VTKCSGTSSPNFIRQQWRPAAAAIQIRAPPPQTFQVTVLRDNIGLNDRQARFVKLCASGEHSVAQCYAKAGYGDPAKPDSANAAKLRKSLDSFIQAERERLGLAPLGKEEESASDPGEVAALIADQRRLYAMAIEKGETGTAQKCLRAIERLLRKPGKPGRPTTQVAPASNSAPSFAPRMTDDEWQAVFELAFTPAELATYTAKIEASRETEEQRALWIEGKPNRYFALAYPNQRYPHAETAET